MKNRGELVIHIGPPKTASTSLQYFFQELEHPEIVYGGICQPRTSDQDSLGKKIYAAIVKDNKEILWDAIDCIENYLESGRSVFISEEMFLVESKYIGFTTKISRFLEFFKAFNPIIMLTLRDPREVLRSYYTQVYHSLVGEKKNFEHFIQSSYCEVYKYRSLQNSLYDIGVREIKFLSYDSLVAAQYFLKDIFNNIEANQKIILDKKNVSITQGTQRRTKRVDLKMILLKRINIENYPFFKHTLFKKIFYSIPRIGVGEVEVNTDISEGKLKFFIEEYEQIKNSCV